MQELLSRPVSITPLHHKVFQAAEREYLELMTSGKSDGQIERELIGVSQLMNEAALMGNSRALARMGDIAARLGLPRDAESRYRSSLAAEERASTWFKLGVLEPRRADSLDCLKRAVKLEPSNEVYKRGLDAFRDVDELIASVSSLSLKS